MPITMEGTPLSTSAVKRTALASLVPRPNSARKMPPAMPTGIPIRLPTPSRIAEPAMALAMPPPDSPTGFGTWVKKSQLNELAPL